METVGIITRDYDRFTTLTGKSIHGLLPRTVLLHPVNEPLNNSAFTDLRHSGAVTPAQAGAQC
jgi:hypothetical protein